MKPGITDCKDRLIRCCLFFICILFSIQGHAAITWIAPLAVSGFHDNPRSACEAFAAIFHPDKSSYVARFEYTPGSFTALCNVNTTDGTSGNTIFINRVGGSCSGDEILIPEEGRCETQSGSDPVCTGNPIQLAGGNKFQVERDYIGAGAFPMEFSRYYNSNLGYWRHSYSRELTPSFTVAGGNTVPIMSEVLMGSHRLLLRTSIKYTI